MNPILYNSTDITTYCAGDPCRRGAVRGYRESCPTRRRLLRAIHAKQNLCLFDQDLASAGARGVGERTAASRFRQGLVEFRRLSCPRRPRSAASGSRPPDWHFAGRPVRARQGAVQAATAKKALCQADKGRRAGDCRETRRSCDRARSCAARRNKSVRVRRRMPPPPGRHGSQDKVGASPLFGRQICDRQPGVRPSAGLRPLRRDPAPLKAVAGVTGFSGGLRLRRITAVETMPATTAPLTARDQQQAVGIGQQSCQRSPAAKRQLRQAQSGRILRRHIGRIREVFGHRRDKRN